MKSSRRAPSGARAITYRLILTLCLAFLIVPLGLVLFRGTPAIVACLGDAEIRFAIGLSLWTSVLSTAVCLVVALPAALALYELASRRRRLVETVLYVPMSLPHLVAGIALLLLFGRLGIGQQLFDLTGLDFVYTPLGVVTAQVFINLPFAIRSLLQSLDEVDRHQVFVARTLGCSALQSDWHIVIPQITGGIATTLVMSWSHAMGEFGAVMMLAGTTRLKTEVIPTAIYLSMSTGDMDLALGLATILAVVTLAAVSVFVAFDRRRTPR